MLIRETTLRDLEVITTRALEDNYVYLLRYSKQIGLIVVDPSEHVPVEKILGQRQEKLSWILNTHHHYDHVGGNHKLKAKFECQVICSAYDQKRIADADKVFIDGPQNINGLEFTAIPVPGHTLGHTALYLKNYGILFSGDTLFSLGCGRLFEGTYEQMFNSLQKLKALPSDTLLLCGHEYTLNNGAFTLQQRISAEHKSEVISRMKYVENCLQKNELPLPTVLGWEIKNNLFLKAETLEEFRELRKARDHF